MSRYIKHITLGVCPEDAEYYDKILRQQIEKMDLDMPCSVQIKEGILRNMYKLIESPIETQEPIEIYFDTNPKDLDEDEFEKVVTQNLEYDIMRLLCRITGEIQSVELNEEVEFDYGAMPSKKFPNIDRRDLILYKSKSSLYYIGYKHFPLSLTD